jgi:cell division protein FtsQ
MGPYFHVWTINISGNKSISGQALHHLSDIHYGAHSWSLDEEKAIQKVEHHPWIRSADITWDFPSQVQITVEEERIHALLALKKLWYINEDGNPFHVAQAHDLDYPIITGIPQDWVSLHPHVVQRIIQDGLKILSAIEEFEYIQSIELSEIYFQKDLGFSIILHNGSKIIFGFYDPKDRLERLAQMIENGLSLETPQQIVLDAERVAVVIPLKTQ